MKPSLQVLPVQLVDHIASYLVFKDILNLRLTSPEPLERMVYMTAHDRVASLLRDCTLVGVLGSCTPGSDEQSVEYVRLLTEAFINLKQRSPQTGLDTLRLSVSLRTRHHESDDGIDVSKPFERPPRRITWETAQQTFDVTMTAICKSRLAVTSHLHLFSSFPACGLVYNAFLPLSQRFVATGLHRSLERLASTFSAPHTRRSRTERDGSLITSSHAVRGTLLLRTLLEMSSLMPNLKEIDIHWYDMGSNTLISPEDDPVPIAAADYPESTRLQACCLRGLYVPGSDLLEFLKTIQPERLFLFDIRLVSGTWAPIFEYLTSSDSTTTLCKLDDIREDHRLVHFEVPGQSKFRYSEVVMGPSTLTKSQDDVKDPIRYRTTWKRALGSGPRMRWWRSKEREYGPDIDPSDVEFSESDKDE
ncbi:hypothetical protein F4810DRAFT_713494 [Camillea tinctor]|nr:hypothetical protein F4810DRAFT_713494 [Camillea tinctor]